MFASLTFLYYRAPETYSTSKGVACDKCPKEADQCDQGLCG